MAEDINFENVPYLPEILNFLPINPNDIIDVNGYINKVATVVAVNHTYNQYQYAYFGIHLLYMTYLYSAVSKVSELSPEEYKLVSAFAKAYAGKQINPLDVKSIFDYHKMMEADIGKFFKAINIDEDSIKAINKNVQYRNQLAHASGEFKMLTESDFEIQIDGVRQSIESVQSKIMPYIIRYATDMVFKFVRHEFSNDYANVDELVESEFIQELGLSREELLTIYKYFDLNNIILPDDIDGDVVRYILIDFFEYCIDNYEFDGPTNFVIDKDPKYYFYKYEDNASDYIEDILGISSYICGTQGGEFPQYDCPECETDQLVFDSEQDKYYCLHCQEEFERNELAECSRCGILTKNNEIPMCENCKEYYANQ